MNDAIESKMQFVKVDGCYFKLETCPTMSSLGVKTCDFLILKKARPSLKLLIIEAKSSAPQPIDIGGDPKRWDRFIQEIYEKLLNSLLVFVGLKVERPYHEISELPPHIKEAPLSILSIIPCLVLRDHPDYALPPVSDALKSKLNPIVRSFALDPPIVINSALAIKYGLVESVV